MSTNKNNNSNLLKQIHETLGDDIIKHLPQKEIRRLKLKFKNDNESWDTPKVIDDIINKYPELKNKITKKRKICVADKQKNKKQKIINDTDSSDEDYIDESESTSDDYDYSDGFVVRDDYQSNTLDDYQSNTLDDYQSNKVSYELSEEFPNNLSEESLNKNLDIYDEKMTEIRKDYTKSIITMHDIISAKFNNTDSLWFYRNFKRQSKLEGKEKYDLEDTVRRRYKLLRNLQSNDMYINFNKDSERDISKDILDSKHSKTVKHILLNRMLNAVEESNEEYQKALTWMDTILSLPTETKCINNNINMTLTKLYKHLKLHLYGMDKIIHQILQAVCVILTDPEKKGYVLTLTGPPGVGKTTISSLISEAINMGFGQVSCGSINDRATIMGHSSTYIGSKPGIFTQIQINAGQLDNVILLDEMDKLPDSKMTPILLQVLDKTQNNRFKDEYCPEVSVDLSKVMFIVSVNDISMFDSALLDRLKIINIDGYDIQTKIHICSKHIIPKIMKRTGININITSSCVKQCIERVSPSISGVRELERFFSNIYEKLLLIKSFKDDNIMKRIYGFSDTFDVNKLKTLNMEIINKL